MNLLILMQNNKNRKEKDSMKPMLPSLTFDLPKQPDWFYEVKYDGFRALLAWNNNEMDLTSRNGKSLLPQFPEIKTYLQTHKERFKPFFPLLLDCELVFLENPYRANFTAIQVRGRLKAVKKVLEVAMISPCHLMVFDLLIISGKQLHSQAFYQRKCKLVNLFQTIDFHVEADPNNDQLLQVVRAHENFEALWENIVLYDGEGIVAKQKNSIWEEGKRSLFWLKYKNWKYVSCFVTSYDKTNGYFCLGVFRENKIYQIGQVLFGFKADEKQALHQTIKNNMKEENKQFIFVNPAVCLEIKYLEQYDNQLREPHFNRFRFDLIPQECTYEHFLFQQKNLPEELEITHPDKPLWKNFTIQKIDYIHYLREVSPFMLPFLENRLLTVIRYPHGTFGEPFYQKNCPDYAPDFVQTHNEDNINYIVCNNLKTLIWLGNQLAMEFHIPFQTLDCKRPSEIVFDLDPPSKEAFHLAIKAALLIKEVLDQLNLIGFIKTSGNKGLQIYLPLPENVYTYDETRLFTAFIADYLISQDPNSFTTERLKKNRGNKLYVDYVQYSAGKTIVAPYSMRGNDHAGVATPLFWEEVDEHLKLLSFNMANALSRIQKKRDPFKNYFQTKQIQPFSPVLEIIKQGKKKG
jgi:bifunctional non-homologous end joining protein LigD